MGNRKKKQILVLVSIILSIVLLELGARLFLPATPLHTGYTLDSDHLVDQALQRARERPDDKPIPIRIKTERSSILPDFTSDSIESFVRGESDRWGNPETNKTKILVIGDSHTGIGIEEESENLAWYDYLETEFANTELFAIGMGGAGATQEYLMLNQSIDIIDPDIVLWQFCQNDYWNDNYRKNRARWPFTGNSIEPFPINGNIKYRLPSPLSDLRKQSKALDLILSKFQILAVQSPQNSRFRKVIKKYFDRDAPPDYEVTEQMIEGAINKTEGRGSKFYLIKISGPTGSKDRFGICNHINTSCIKGIDKHVINKGKELNMSVDRGDGHWNVPGNRIAGKFLARYFKDHIIEN